MATPKEKPKFGSAEWRKLHPAKKKEATPSDAINERLAQLESSITNVLDMLERQAAKPAPVAAVVAPETPAELAVTKARANSDIPMNPDWEERAREIVGEALDHCEINYMRNGGVIFSVIIKEEFSNAPKDYLAFYKQDRRSKDIGSEGIEGVDNWCKLIKSNLARPKPLSNRE